MVNFKVSRVEHEQINEIVDRAMWLVTRKRLPVERRDILMDLTAVHANGCPLRLDELAGADEFDFIHDVFGIRRHLDRSTGKLGGCFVPRFASR